MELSYLDEYYYMLLLEVGFKEDVNNWINLIAEEKNSLDGIYLDLVCNLGDNNKVISCLYNYIGENKVDNDALAEKLRLFILDKYENGLVDTYKAIDALSGFADITNKWYDKSFYNFLLVGEAYDLYQEGIITKEKLDNIVDKFLKTGENIDYDSLFNKKQGFIEILKEEKKQMNKIRSFVNFTIVPIILLITCIFLVTIMILLNINEEKYTPLAVSLFIIIGVIYTILLVTVPFIRKKELQIELAKYDFTIDEEVKEEYTIKSNLGLNVVFKKDGIYVNNNYYKYEELRLNLGSSNYLLKVNLYIDVVVKNSNSYIKPYWYIKLDKELINAVLKYNIKLDNHDKFVYIINNKEDAFKQILNYGYIKKKNN